jgi:arginyl-tRNA synthetase
VITAELRRAIVAAAGLETVGLEEDDPLLRPGPTPGSYASSLPFRLVQRSGPGQDPRDAAARLAARLNEEQWIATAEVTGAGFLTVTVTHDALAVLAVRIARAGPACAASDALRGRTVPAPAQVILAAEPGWPQARAALAAELTARLAAAAGSTLIYPERAGVPPSGPLPPAPGGPERAVLPPSGPPPSAQAEPERALFSPPAPRPPPPVEAQSVAGAIAYAGADGVRFALARMPPGGVAPQAAVIARHVLSNPAYAVRYAHAAAAAVLRWAAALGIRPAAFQPRLLAEPGELVLLDALSWLPERVAMAARRGRPDEFARYLEGLAARTIDTMSTTGFRKISEGSGGSPRGSRAQGNTVPPRASTVGISSERLWLADAARTGLAAGLELLGVSAPSRL